MSTLFILLFLSLAISNNNFCNGSFGKGCIESEREALLMFKQDLIDDANLLASWTHLHEDSDCCGWVGVVCDNVTGHVLELHLGYRRPFLDEYATNAEFQATEISRLRGKINPSLLRLKHLSYLDLRNNAFGGIHIPKFLGSIKSLRYLNLLSAEFGGLVPCELGNLSSLQYLNLANYDYYYDNLYVANLQWLCGLSSLEHLDLGNVDLTKATNWFQVLNTLPSLQNLYLSNCYLPHVTPPPTKSNHINNLSSVTILDFSHNSLGNLSSVGWIFRLNTLISLDLSYNDLGGCLPDDLENMTSLRHLDLSFNNFSTSIPNWLYNLKSLQFLSLASSNLNGEISSAIGNITSLGHLDLSSNNFNSSIPDSLFSLKSLQFLYLNSNNLKGEISSAIGYTTSLVHLDLSWNSFNSSIPDSLFSLKSLQFLYLNSNNLKGEISSAIGNVTSAISLDFSLNEIEGPIPRSMGNLCNLKSIKFSRVNLNQDVSEILQIFSICVSEQLNFLDLSSTKLFGELTNGLGNFKNLKELHLQNNSISSPIPFSVGELSSLRVLDLSSNQLKGQLPESIGQLANLEEFDISNNLLHGTVVSEIHFANLTKLEHLNAYGNVFFLKSGHDWIPPFQLETLRLGNCGVGSQIPLWLRSQKYLIFLDISNSTISDIIPSWFWNSIIQFQHLNLSHNQIHGKIPNILVVLSFDKSTTIDLSFNSFGGLLPRMSSNISFLDLSNNYLSGSLFPLICFNNLSETKTMGMEVLKLSGNFLSGEIPDCWMKWQYLGVLRLDNNNLTGRIPSSMGSLPFLESLKLRKNNLFGEIPLSLKNCTYLTLLDFGDNELHGNISKWLVQDQRLPFLSILSLRSNKFWGHIPDQLCAFSSLHILDLGNNNLIGSLPRCIGNFTSMVRKTDLFIMSLEMCDSLGLCVPLLMMMKGQMLEYTRNLELVRSIDVSNNKLSGEIPIEVTTLFELQSLNLSHNLFTGTIPESIGLMRSLESLDFSVNKLSGSIPRSMTNLTFLSNLNLSSNNLTGEIPSSTQLQSFNPSSFGNNHLCGSPLPHKCSHTNGNGAIAPNNGDVDEDDNGESENGFETFWFCLGLPFGFVVGFWSVVGPFLIKRRLCCGILDSRRFNLLF